MPVHNDIKPGRGGTFDALIHGLQKFQSVGIITVAIPVIVRRVKRQPHRVDLPVFLHLKYFH